MNTNGSPFFTPFQMAFNAEDNWDFPAAAVVAAEAAVLIGPEHAAPGEANPGAVLQVAVLQREIRALGSTPTASWYCRRRRPRRWPPRSSRSRASTKA
jgi:hypothetical protein